MSHDHPSEANSIWGRDLTEAPASLQIAISNKKFDPKKGEEI
jgi:hypothetical protein